MTHIALRNCLLMLAVMLAGCTAGTTGEHVASFERIATIGLDEPTDADGQPLFGSILDVSVDAEGRLYVLDSQYLRIRIFTATGDLSRTIQLQRGSGPGEVQRPTGVSVGRDGTLYVLDFLARRVLMFDSEGVFQKAIPAQGMTTQVHATGDRLVLTRLWMTSGEDILYVHDADGTFLTQFLQKPEEGELIGRSGNFGRMATTPSGSLLYSFPYPYRIVELDMEGTTLREATGQEAFTETPTPIEQGMVQMSQRSNGVAVVSDDLVVNTVLDGNTVYYDLFDRNLSFTVRLDSTQTGISGVNTAKNMVSDGRGHLYFSMDAPTPHIVKVGGGMELAELQGFWVAVPDGTRSGYETGSPVRSGPVPSHPNIMILLVDGVLRVHVVDNYISGPNGRVALEHRVMEVFRVLLEKPGTVVLRDELLAAVWSDVCVSDGSLSKAVSELRRALKESGCTQQLVATVTKRGYRLDGVVTRDTAVRWPTHQRTSFRFAGIGILLLLFVFSGRQPDVKLLTLDEPVPEGVLLPITEYVSGSSRIKLKGVTCDENMQHTVQEFRQAFREERLPDGCSRTY